MGQGRTTSIVISRRKRLAVFAILTGIHRRSPLAALLVVVLQLAFAAGAQAQSLSRGVSAFNRQDYAQASRAFIPLAERGNPSAQAYLGFMFETGRGVPQNYTEAAMWYRRAAEQGDSLAQYS